MYITICLFSRSQGFSAQRAAAEGTAPRSCQGASPRSSAHAPPQTAHAGFARRTPGMLGVPPPPQPRWQFSRAAAKGPASPRCPSPSSEVELKARGVCPSFPNRNYPGQGCQACCLLQTPPDLSCLHGSPEVPALSLTHAVLGCPEAAKSNWWAQAGGWFSSSSPSPGRWQVR